MDGVSLNPGDLSSKIVLGVDDAAETLLLVKLLERIKHWAGKRIAVPR